MTRGPQQVVLSRPRVQQGTSGLALLWNRLPPFRPTFDLQRMGHKDGEAPLQPLAKLARPSRGPPRPRSQKQHAVAATPASAGPPIQKPARLARDQDVSSGHTLMLLLPVRPPEFPGPR